MSWRLSGRFVFISACAVLALGRAALAGPWAAQVVSYDAGSTAVPGFTSADAALGEPSRFTNDASFPGVVSLFNPAFLPSQIVSIGEGGHLTVRFDEPVSESASHLYGIDLIIFGNAFFAGDFSMFPEVRQQDPATLFDTDGGWIEVSADGVNFVRVAELADRLFPTQGYLDGGPFDVLPGASLTDFRRPVNPALTLADFDGLSYADSVALYDGSGGGTPIDLAQTGLASVSYVRVSVPDDGNPDTAHKAEIDAFASVPEPATAAVMLLAMALIGPARRRPVRGESRCRGLGARA